MITDIGKNIVAKYLIGDATAYASYIALGCGPRPRPNITSLTSVDTLEISGTISSTAQTTTITGIASTTGFVVGMSLEKISGAGAFGGTSQVATVSSIDSTSQITITTTGANTAGAIVFRTFGVATILDVADTDPIWVGAKLSKISSTTGSLSSVADTLVSSINSDTSFTIKPGIPTGSLTNANLLIEIDPAKKSLDFEMLRIPITSRGYVNDNGVNKIVMTAQLPSEERYEFSEIGIYSAGSNSSAGAYDSKTITAFSGSESWELNTGNSITGPSLTSTVFQEFETSVVNASNVITSAAAAIKTTNTNGLFVDPVRAARYEKPRFLSNVFMLRGDTSYLYKSNGNLVAAGTPKFLQVTGETVDFTRNSSSDLLKLAFSIVATDGASLATPDNVRVVVEFSNNDGSQYAKMQVEATDSEYRFTDNRYIVATKRLDELFYSPQFSWKNVTTIKVYTSVLKKNVALRKASTGGLATITTQSNHGLSTGDAVTIAGVGAGFDGIQIITDVPSSTTFKFAKTGEVIDQELIPTGTIESGAKEYFIALDALRLDNVNTVNPLYGLVGYSIIQNEDRQLITKAPNTTNYIEYRFIMDVT